MWIARADYERLVRQVESAQESLDIERAENRRAERHWANMWLRHMRTFPLQPSKPTSAPAATGDTSSTPPPIDPGELEALVEAGAAMGVSEQEVKRFLALERERELS